MRTVVGIDAVIVAARRRCMPSLGRKLKEGYRARLQWSVVAADTESAVVYYVVAAVLAAALVSPER